MARSTKPLSRRPFTLTETDSYLREIVDKLEAKGYTVVNVMVTLQHNKSIAKVKVVPEPKGREGRIGYDASGRRVYRPHGLSAEYAGSSCKLGFPKLLKWVDDLPQVEVAAWSS